MTVNDIIDKYYPIGSKSRSYYLPHVSAVADFARRIIDSHPELSVDTTFVIEGAMLHDIGCCRVNAPRIGCYGTDDYIRHGIIGAGIVMEEGYGQYANVCITHIGAGITASDVKLQGLLLPETDMLPQTLEEQIICYADKFFSKSDTNLINPKSIERVRQSVLSHGEDSYIRFEKMHAIFGIEY